MMTIMLLMMKMSNDDELDAQDLEVNNRQLLSNTERMRTELDRVVQVTIIIIVIDFSVFVFFIVKFSGTKSATGEAAGVHEAPRGVHGGEEGGRPRQHGALWGKEGRGLGR